MPIHHPHLTPEPQEPDPRSFFVDMVPKLLQTKTRSPAPGEGSIGFVLEGDLGGSWTVDLSGGSVIDGVAGASFCMNVASKDFALMMNGKLDVIGALQSGKIRMTGTANTNALRAFVNLLP